MTITKPKRKEPALSTAKEEDFITGAPDGSQAIKGVKKGNKQQISLTITPELLAKVDELAAKMGQSRAAVINLAIYQTVEKH